LEESRKQEVSKQGQQEELLAKSSAKKEVKYS
jgi:hypothetical protein